MIESEYMKLVQEGRIYYGKDNSAQPNIIRYLSELDGLVPWTWWPASEVGHTDEARKAIQNIFGSQAVFDTPKPTRLLQRVLEIGTRAETSDLVVDFFAGSGTMGESVMLQNKLDGGNRRYLMVQLPEPIENADFSTVAAVTKARLKHAGNKLRMETESRQDYGFRTFKLDTSNIRAWNPTVNDLKSSLFDHLEHLEVGRSSDDILYEILLKLGLDLCVPIEKREIAGKQVNSVGAGVLMTCLDESIKAAEVEALTLGMVAWRKEQDTVGDTTAVFRDSAFENDVAKSNLAAILEQHGIKQVRSL